MNFANPISVRVERSLESTLTTNERLIIAWQLGSSLLAGCLLLAGALLRRVAVPEQAPLADVCQGLAAVVVSLPVWWRAAIGLVTANPGAQSAQLVALASLAAIAFGDMLTATLVPLVMSLGHFLEERGILGAQAAIDGLHTIQARSAALLTPNGEREVRPADLKFGDTVIIRPGDVIPADGAVLTGASAIDQSSITGESAPEEVVEGSKVFAGTINLTGLLHVTVTQVGAQSEIGKVLGLLRGAEQSKTPVLKLIERYAGYLMLLVLTVAGLTLFLTRDASRFIAVLVVGCPGAFILAGPTAMIASLSAASRLGILIKNSRFLESLSDVDTVILDKTGTVTLGQLEVSAINPAEPFTTEDVLRGAARCAAGSKHPICRAVVRAAKSEEISLEQQAGLTEEFSGRGVRWQSNEDFYLLGRAEWLQETGLEIAGVPGHSGSIVWLSHSIGGEHRVVGCILLADTPRPEAAVAINQLRELGVGRSILLTGDRREVARRVGETLQVGSVVAEVLPDQKLAVVQAEKAEGRTVMVVGDGVNDALALAAGDVGIAMGAMGSDIALQSADIVLMANDLKRLPQSIVLARKTRSVIHQNVLAGAAISFFMLFIASVGWVSPLGGAILHNLGEIFVLFNSARLLRTGTSYV